MTSAAVDHAVPSFPTVRLGVSACLLGEPVRFDRGHKQDRFLTDVLGQHIEWVSVCPEVEVGMGIPRESLRLVGTADGPRLIAPRSGTDHTEEMTTWARRRVADLADADLDGFILKKDSPSCGMARVRVYPQPDGGAPNRDGQGMFARALTAGLPLLPIEEEGRLQDPRLRENFIARVFAHHRWRTFRSGCSGPGDLVAFHTRHKLALMSHHEPTYRQMGRLVARAGAAEDLSGLLDEYGARFMRAQRHHATRKQHANVLYHLLGYLRDVLDDGDRGELVDEIERYRIGQTPLVVPLTLFRHHFRRHPHGWVNEQTYLAPYPAELMLRNHV